MGQIESLFKYELFEGWSSGAVKKLYYLLEFQKFIWKQTVYKQNEEAEGIYFIRSGEFQVN